MKITRQCSPIVLSEIVNLQRDVLVKWLDDTCGESIPDPIVKAPVIKDFITGKHREFYSVWSNRMFDLEPVAISGGVDLRHSKAPLNKVSITETKLAFLEAQSCRKVQSILMRLSAFEWLSFDSQIEW